MTSIDSEVDEITKFCNLKELKYLLSEWKAEDKKKNLLDIPLSKITSLEVARKEVQRVYRIANQGMREAWIGAVHSEKQRLRGLLAMGNQVAEAGYLKVGKMVQATLMAPSARWEGARKVEDMRPWNAMQYVNVEITTVAKGGQWFDATVAQDVTDIYDVDHPSTSARETIRAKTVKVQFYPYDAEQGLWRTKHPVASNNYLECSNEQLARDRPVAPDEDVGTPVNFTNRFLVRMWAEQEQRRRG